MPIAAFVDPRAPLRLTRSSAVSPASKALSYGRFGETKLKGHLK
jgi:hypothetical protein